MPRLILVNARIRTFDPSWPEQSAMVCENGRISWIGDDFTARTMYRDGDELEDLEAKSVFPAFHDAHTHFYHYALTLRRLRLDDSHSEANACQGVRGTAERAQPGDWIVGRGWSLRVWGTDQWPTRASLDEAAPRNPVALAAKDGHTWWVNSAALALAGVSRETKDPPGGVIVRDQAGEPTGILREKALELVKPFLTSPPERAVLGGLREATDQFHSLGVASADILAGSMGRDAELEEGFRVLQKMERAGALGLRLTIYFPAHDLDRLVACGLRSGFGGDWVRFGGIKLYADGSLGSRTAAMLEPYAGTQDRGVEVMSAKEMAAVVTKAAEHGIASAIHAIGDRAVRNALDAFQAARAPAEKNALRQRIEHAQCVNLEDAPRFAHLGVACSVQLSHAASDRDLAEDRWADRLEGAYAYRTLAAAGALLANGSDAPIEELDPLEGIRAGVLRTLDEREAWRPEQALTVEQALAAATVNPAFLSGDEHRRGTLVPGRLADLVVLDRDPLACAPGELPGIEVVATMVGGRWVHNPPPWP